MSVASARAISSHRNAATREGLERSVAWSRQWSAEFPFCLANHLPMVLVALHRMGASDERLEAYCRIYHEQNGLTPIPERIGEISRDNWRDFLGQREREGDYRAFFAGEVATLGATPAAIHYLPQLMPGMAASATHAFMRMAYATMTDSDEETGVALAYWAATYLSLGPSRGAKPSTDDPARGSRVHVRAGGVPACRARARSLVALHARGRPEAGIRAGRRYAGNRAGDP